MKNVFGNQFKPSDKDPIMINLHGLEVQIPRANVQDMLKKGFKFKDETQYKEDGSMKTGPAPEPSKPFSRHRIEEELSEEFDHLEVTSV